MALRPFDLTHTQFSMLAAVSWLGREPAPSRQEVAAFAGTDRMMTSKVLAGLEQPDLVARGGRPLGRPGPPDLHHRRRTATGGPVDRRGRAVDRDLFQQSGDALRPLLMTLVDQVIGDSPTRGWTSPRPAAAPATPKAPLG